ncbi:MAG: DUF6273 domain-containing protein [Lachnospiraceae bacterium]|nr:DUF6273 domain-containing protein [Lachnospiraceae bacterium]
MAKKFLALLLAAVCMVSVVATSNPVEVSAKDKYKKGDYITFGSYEQDGNKENGAEPIEWEILDVKDGKLLVISRYILDAKPYNEKNEDVTWETCTLRKWLNKDFYDSAFKAGEKKKIVKTKISNPDNKYYGTDGGKATKDNVFLLSVSEIRKYYKFNRWDNYYMSGSSQALMTEGTQYAKVNGLSMWTIIESDYNEYLKSSGYKKNCIGRTFGWWWLRSPGCNSDDACRVSNKGSAGASLYFSVAYDYVGVRPALYIEY